MFWMCAVPNWICHIFAFVIFKSERLKGSEPNLINCRIGKFFFFNFWLEFTSNLLVIFGSANFLENLLKFLSNIDLISANRTQCKCSSTVPCRLCRQWLCGVRAHTQHQLTMNDAIVVVVFRMVCVYVHVYTSNLSVSVWLWRMSVVVHVRTVAVHM